MGDAIRTVVRYADGRVVSGVKSTVVIPGLQNSDRFLAGDEGYVGGLMDELAEDADDEAAEAAPALAPYGYGILVIDFTNMAVVDCNYYSPFATSGVHPAVLLQNQLSSLDGRDGIERMARMLAERRVSIERIPYRDPDGVVTEVLACDLAGLDAAVRDHYARVPYVDTGYARFVYDLAPWKVTHAREWEVLPALERLGFDVTDADREAWKTHMTGG